MVERLGFDGGRILEPSAGIGHFFGLMPLSIRSKSDLTGIELDDLSGHILRALYPEAHIHIEGFEQQRIPNNSYSLVISNVPFGTFKVHDTFDRDLSSRFEIHDYFIAKSIRKLKPGGLGVFITSTATLDRSANLRNWVVNDGNADFIGAVRLNTGTFKNTAGTETGRHHYRPQTRRSRAGTLCRKYAIDHYGTRGALRTNYQTVEREGKDRSSNGTHEL